MTPTGNTGWFPRYNPDGSRVTWERPNYWQAQWLTDTTEIAHDGGVILIAGQATAYPAPNELSAGGVLWAGFRPDPVRVYTSWGLVVPGAGCPTLNPAGDFAYVDDRQADVKSLIVNNVAISRGAITDVRASRQAIVWSDGGQTWGARIPGGTAARIQAAPREFRPIPIDTPDGPWVGNHTDTGLVVRPFGETYGYRFDNGGQCFYPDWTFRGGAIVAIFTNDAGVQFEQTFDLSASRVPLGTVVDPDPPIVTVPPEPEPPEPPEPEPGPEPIPPTPQEPIMAAYGTIIPGFKPGDLVDNGNGTVSAKKPNGKYLCVTPDGGIEERDSPGGVWESFVRDGTALIAYREKHAPNDTVYVLPLVGA